MANKILGIDIRVCAVKVVEITKTPKGPFIDKLAMGEIPSSLLDKHPEKEIAQAKVLKELLQKNKFSTRHAVVTIAGPDVIIKRIALPQMPINERRQSIALQLENLLPYPVEEAVFDYYKLTSSSNNYVKSLVDKSSTPEADDGRDYYLVAIIKREAVNRIIDVSAKAGIKIVSITVVPVSLQAAYGPLLGSEETAVIYIGSNSTNISVYKDKELVVNREIALGGDSITYAMTGTVISSKGRIDLDFAAAEKLKTAEGLPLNFEEYTQKTGIPGDELYAMIRPAVEKIEAEILRSFDYFGVKALRIILTGGASQTKQLPETLAQALRMQIEKIDPPIKAVSMPEKGLAQFSAAIGAGIEEGKRINLLPQEYRNRWAILFQKMVQNPWIVGTSVTAAALLVFIFQTISYNSINKELQSAKAQFSVNAPDIQRFELMEKKLGGAGSFNQDRFIKILNELDVVIPSNVGLQRIEYTRAVNKLQIKGTTSGTVTAFMGILKANKMMRSVDLVSFSKVSEDEGSYDFTINCGLIQ